MARKQLQLEVARVDIAAERDRAFVQAIRLIRSKAGSGRASHKDMVRQPGSDGGGDQHDP